MKNFRFAHIADAHVGAWPKDEAMRAALRASVLRAVETVEKEKCDFLLIAGDLFHKPIPEPAEVAPLARALKRLNDVGIRIYAIFGSHDYVMHDTSWLDVLSDAGLFVRVAPPPVVEEGKKWSLPWTRDERTRSVIAGISARPQGLDRKVYDTMDSSAFVAEEGFKIFLFHAGVLDYLPSGLSGKIEGIAVDALPAGCGYYAGGHIHATYHGPGPGGIGTLVNPGAVFGTSVTDLEAINDGRTQAGVVIVDVDSGRATPRWVITTDPSHVKVVNLDVEGCDDAEVMRKLRGAVPRDISTGTVLVPRFVGSPARQLNMDGFTSELRSLGISTFHIDIETMALPEEAALPPGETSPDRMEEEVFSRVLSTDRTPGLAGKDGVRVAKELLRSLGAPKEEGKSGADYKNRVLRQGLRILGLEPGEGAPP